MKGRRALVEGLNKSSDLSEAERDFVYGDDQTARPIAAPAVETSTPPLGQSAETKLETKVLPQMAGRVPVTVRCRPEVASAIKRVSLQRQLDGIEPFYVQDIMEQALENWLSRNGYPTSR